MPETVPTAPAGPARPATNWAGNVVYRAARLHRPTSVAELQEIVAGSRRVKALGSRHCFNDIADTTADLVTLDGLPGDVAVRNGGDSVVIEAPTSRAAWSAAQIAVSQTSGYGVSRVELGDRSWTADPRGFAWWSGEGTEGTTVTIFFDDVASPTPTPGR